MRGRNNLSVRVVVYAVRALYVLSGVLIMLPGLAGAQLTVDGQIADRANRYDGYPSHLYVKGVHHLYFCGQSPITGADAVYHTTNSVGLDSLASWSAPVEVLNHPDVPWAPYHICDPSILPGPITYNSTPYAFALYFTADLSGQGQTGDNAVGVAFSNDGVNWTVHPNPIITPDGGYDGSYGAGAGASAWSHEAGKMVHIYRDSTTGFGDWRVRYKESTDGVNFSPTPSLDTNIAAASDGGNGAAPAMCYFPVSEEWHGAIHNVAGSDPDMPIRVIRAKAPNNVFGSWQTLEFLDPASAGEELVLLPALSRTENSTLYVTPQGWSYLFYTAGNEPENSPGVKSWYVGQARFRVFKTLLGAHFADSFASTGPLRAPGMSLDGRLTEIGSRDWDSALGYTFDAGSITGSGGTGRIPFSQGDAPNDPVLSIEAMVDPSSSSWVGIGFFSAAGGGFFSGSGAVWMHLTSSGDIRVNADSLAISLANEAVPSFSTGFNKLRLAYDASSNSVSAWVNYEQFVEDVDLSQYGFTPSIQYAGFQFLNGTAGTTRLDRFAVNGPFGLMFEDAFESGSFAGWDLVSP